MNPELHKTPDFLADRTPIIGRFYGPQEATTRAYARVATQAGLATYPDPDSEHRTIFIQNINNPDIDNPGETFYFQGNLEQADSPANIQMDVFRHLQATEDKLAAIVAVHNDANSEHDEDSGYIGESTAVEIGYLMATGKPFILSRSITKFSPRVSPALRAVIEKCQIQYPIIPPEHFSVESAVQTLANFVPPVLTEEEKKAVMFEVVHLERKLREQYPGQPQKYQVHAPSVQSGKVGGAKEGARAYQRKHYPDTPTIAIELDARKFPSGEGQPRPEQPIAVNGYREIEEAVDARIAQFDEALALEGDGPKEGVIRLTVAQESGVHIDFTDPDHTVTEDVTVCKVKNLDTGEVSKDISDPVPVLPEDVERVVMLILSGVMSTTIGKVVQERLAKKGIQVDHQDWYVQYDAPNNDNPQTKNKPRAYYIKQASKRAAEDS